MGGITDLLMEESHETIYSIHLYNTKMFIDIKPYYWWPMMKLDVVMYVAECVACARVKTQHQKPYRSLKRLLVPIGKCEDISINFITKLSRTKGSHDIIWVIVEQLTKCAFS